MSIYAPERSGSGSGFDDGIDYLDFDIDFEDAGGNKPKGHEPYPVKHLVGKVGIEGFVTMAEARLETGQPLSERENQTLAEVGEDLLDDYDR